MIRPRLFSITGASLVGFFAITGAGFAQTAAAPPSAGKDGPTILDNSTQLVNTSNQTVEACWSAWLTKEGLFEGRNERNGDLLLVQKGKEIVSADRKAPQWLATRDVAFQRSEIQARQAMSDAMATEIRSGRTITNQAFGGDDSPPDLQKIASNLSIADKMNTLTSVALDAEIKKYKPDWNETGIDVAQKRQELLKVRGQFRDQIVANSAMFVSGAFTPVQCEGLDLDGKYAVLVGMIWSPKLAKIADTIWNPKAPRVPASPGGTLKDQFDRFSADNPDWLAYSMGARVFTDEKGERVIVGFGVASQTSLQSMDVSRANLNATAAIQRFVGEKVEANQEQKSTVDQLETVSGDVSIKNISSYEQVTNLFSKEMRIQGATPILSWRGKHPWSGAKMQVVVVAWSANWAADARRTGAIMNDIEQRMQRQGAVPDRSVVGGSSTTETGAGSAVPVRSGAQSTTKDF